MNQVREILKVAIINLMIVATIVGFLMLIPIGTEIGYNIISIVTPGSNSDSRIDIQNYNNIEWAQQHFEDLAELPTTYRDFVVWETKPYKSKTINIGQDGLRVGTNTADTNGDEIWMFGGSAMFGVGSDDQNTIPSWLSLNSEARVTNFGVIGYHARQSLNRLINSYADPYISTDINRTVVFYDGVNDVLHKCRGDNSGSSTARERQIRSSVDTDSLSPRVILEPAVALIGRIRNALDHRYMNSGYVCDKDLDRPARIAQSIVNDWRSADAVARRNGDRFIAILQPVAYLSNTKLEHLDPIYDEWNDLSQQYQMVYPAIRRYALEAHIEFYDFTDIFDRNEYIYIDFCHTSPNGNRYVAEEIANILA